MINRRNFTCGISATLAAATAASVIPTASQAMEIDDNGLHVQDWFLESFLEINDDQQQLDGENKHLAVLFEQRGCPYCREMHEVNFAKPEITQYIQKHFGILQINIWGSKIVTDLDGEELSEKALARKWRVNFTPTIVFLKRGPVTDIPLSLAESARMPGYLKPFHFLSMFEFVATKQNEEQDFQRFLQKKFKRYEAEGKKPDLW